jgi:hypothetical protein
MLPPPPPPPARRTPPTARSAAGVALADDPPLSWHQSPLGGRPGRKRRRRAVIPPFFSRVMLNRPSPRDFVDAIVGLLLPSCSDAWQRHTLRQLCATTALQCNQVHIWCKQGCSRCCTGSMFWGPLALRTSLIGRPTSRRSRDAQWIVSLLRNWQASMLLRMLEFYSIRLIY